MIRFLTALLFLSLATMATTDAYAQWTQAEGASYGKLWGRATIGSAAFDKDGENLPTERFSIVSARVYAEHGLSDRFTLLGFAEPFAFASYGDDAEAAESVGFVGPLMGGLRSAILTGPLKVAFELQLGFTFADGETNLAPEDAGFVFVPAASGGNAAFDVQFGYGFSDFWLSLRTGMGWWSNADVDPAALARFQFGWSGPSGIVLDLRTSFVKPITEVTVTNVAGAGQTEYLGFGLGASWWFWEHMAVAASFEGVLYARSNASTPAFTLGIEAR